MQSKQGLLLAAEVLSGLDGPVKRTPIQASWRG